MTVSPVFASNVEYNKCDSMGKKKGAKYPYKNRMNCFRDLARRQIHRAKMIRQVERNFNKQLLGEARINKKRNIIDGEGTKSSTSTERYDEGQPARDRNQHIYYCKENNEIFNPDSQEGLPCDSLFKKQSERE
jgi:hypothetical protein